MRFFIKFRVLVLLFGLFFLQAASALQVVSADSSPGSGAEGLQQTIHYLLGHVSGSGYTFIRNGNQYTASEAADHMQKKYLHFRDRIKTPEQFIEYAATRSLMSGKPYWVVLDHSKMHTSQWLLGVLADYRAGDQAQ